MSEKNMSNVEACEKAADEITSTLTEMANILAAINPEDLIVTDEMAMEIMHEILAGMPANCRGLYPEDDVLAVIAYAPIYYRLKY